jgi:hypothetical protein
MLLMAMVMMVMVMMAMVMMAMVMMAMVMMVMVSVMVITVSVALRQVGRLPHHLHQSFHRLCMFYYPQLPQTQSLPSVKSFPWKILLFSMYGSLKQAIKQALKPAFKQALEQDCNRQQPLMRTHSKSVYYPSITMNNAGSNNRY